LVSAKIDAVPILRDYVVDDLRAAARPLQSTG
jgi:hypothetical protein